MNTQRNNIVEWGKRHLPAVFLLFLVGVSILWRGGKSLDATWLLAGGACVLTLWNWYNIWHTKKSSPHVHTGLWLVLAGYIGWTVLSYLYSSVGNYGFDEVIRTVSLALIFLWTAQTVAGDHSGKDSTITPEKSSFVQWFMRCIAVITLIACVIGIAVYVFQPVNRFVGTFFDHRFHTDYWPNAWGEYLLLAWPLSAAGLFTIWRTKCTSAVTQRQLIKGVLGLGLIIGCLLLSYSRGSVIAFIGQIVVLAVMMEVAKGWQWFVRHCIIPGAMVAAVALLVFVTVNQIRGSTHTVQSVKEKVTFTADEGKSSINEREQFWKQSRQLTLQRPWLGWGPYSFRFVQPRLQQHVLATSDHPHNVFLKLAMERGLVAALLFTAIILICIWHGAVSAVYRFTGRTRTHEISHEYVLCLVAVAGVLAHNLIDYNLQFTGIALPFWIVLGILVVPFVRKSRTKQHSVTAVIALLLALTTLHEGVYLVTSSLGRRAEAAGDYASAVQWYEDSEPEWFTRDMYLGLANIQYWNLENADGGHRALQRFFAMNEQDGRAWKLQGEFLYHQAKFSEALPYFKKAYQLTRYNDLQSVLGLLRTLKALGKEEELRQMQTELQELSEAYEDAFEQNAHFINLSANVEAMLDLIVLLKEVYPDQSPRYDVLAAKIDRISSEQRAIIQARPPGYLW